MAAHLSAQDRADREARKLKRIENEQIAIKAQAEAEHLTRQVALRAEQQKRRHEMYAKQESSRAPQFQIDQRFTLWLLSALAAFTFISTAALTADGTIGAAASAKFAIDWFGYLLFGAFEVAILAFMLVYYVQGSRIDHYGEPIPATRWFVMMVAVAGLTVALSVYHVLDLYEYAWLSVDMWVGIFVRFAVAVCFVITSKAVASVLFAKAVHL